MKYLKTFENSSNYEVDIFTMEEASKFYWDFADKNEKYRDIDLKDKIHYFHHFDSWSVSDNFRKHCRFIIAYNDIDILGICEFAYYESSKNYAISYCSTNDEYFQKGISKKLLETLFKYFSETYPNETLNFSGYSPAGWYYLRKYILEFAEKYNVKIKEKPMEYPGKNGKQDEEWFKLYNKSKEEIIKKYGSYDPY